MRDLNIPHQLIDVREDFEYEISNIGGELIPLGELPRHTGRISQTRPVVIMCHHGFRSAQAVNFLSQRLGLTNLYNLKGGIHAWSEEIDPEVPIY